jgi:hypothetical protein
MKPMEVRESYRLTACFGGHVEKDFAFFFKFCGLHRINHGRLEVLKLIYNFLSLSVVQERNPRF